MFWILIPQLETEDENLRYYYDFSQCLDEYSRVFRNLDGRWDWRAVLPRTIDSVLSDIRLHSNGRKPIIINCPIFSLIRYSSGNRLPHGNYLHP